MRRSICCAALAGAIAMLNQSAAFAFTPVLTMADRQSAIAGAVAAAKAHRGLPIQGYVVFASPNGLSDDPKRGNVDAVVLVTPYERVRIAAYELAFEDLSPSAAAVETAAAPQTLDVMIFAHGARKDDQRFLRRFGDVTLQLGGNVQRGRLVQTFGPAEDFFTTPGGGRELRFLGYDVFRFDVSPNESSAVAVLSLTEPSGRTHRFTVDLKKYR